MKTTTQPSEQAEALQNRIVELSQSLSFDIGLEESLRIAQFVILLHEYNQKVNLVGTKEIEQIVEKHVLDALSVAQEVQRLGGRRYVDIGCGGGLPGLIVALALKDLKVTLVDSIGKKCKFLDEAVAAFNLEKRVEVINGRAEEMGQLKQYREKFDVGTARAVGTLMLTMELVVPLLKVQGYFIAQKTHSRIKEEIEESKIIALALKLMSRQSKTFEIDGLKDNLLVTWQKTGITARTFPRSWKEIQADNKGL
ncbi:MAG: 16S rRNA (guanine(527)-N(7))-methyltransferase RsmG [Candidatus Obscuribacter sp.]|jgi:16S rRNA (guanine527-N7)-methyltransferase|nr:16S rRNA (guanine(527)-N(7))-methyltransferase RsmG [Candidatus Obscuribacter sp.]MBP6348740.1 16S rRNA (guanine(527)-N(7))-methyltransferase RsmG [Candidatus Obscuribacter sp.]MBP6592361.1 16S rRNA (guanine(527)-N(7))-methyltransferase RsmG [Candidatus Obscuribacter sp.]